MLLYAPDKETARLAALESYPVVIQVDRAGESLVRGTVGLSRREQIEFLKALQALIASGLPLQQCVDLLPGLFPEDSAKYRASLELLQKIRRGTDIGTALRRSTRGFPAYITRSLTLAGEIGSLARILEELIAHYATDYETRQKVANALLYPSFILALVFAATIFVSLHQDAIVSMFSAIVDPQLLEHNLTILLSSFMLLLVAIAGFLLVPAFSTAALKFGWTSLVIWLERVRINLPPFGIYYQERILSMYFSLLHILLRSGLTLERALETLKGATGSLLYDRGTDQILEKIRQGAGLRAALAGVSVFPPIVFTWLGVGEATGDMSRSVQELSRYFASRTADFEKKLSIIVEPLTILVAGGLVILFVLLVVLPLLTSFGNLL